MLYPWEVRARLIYITSLSLLLSACCHQHDHGASQLAKHVEENSAEGDIRAALKAFDECSYKNRLGMHLGTEKGLLIESAVGQGAPVAGPHIVLETGCHAGDGTLRAIAAMTAREGSQIISTEDNAKWLSAAKRVVAHAAKGASINFVPLSLAEDADFGAFLDELREKKGIKHFDTVIFDQDQTQFLNQLRAMWSKGFLRPGSTLYVDNVKTKADRLQTYLQFVSTASGNGFRTTVTDILEPYADAVAVSVFLGANHEL